jgi:phosphopantothenoylcysteine decarboxylase/phosphopantothenate--cysteine ligase
LRILLGITGSIAAYKALELIRLIRKHGDEVRVVLTGSACHFVTPLSCQTLSQGEVYQDQFVLNKGIRHLALSDWADIMVVAPATANLIGKAASGIGDDLLTTTLLSFTKPILIVPAMDEGMWQNKIIAERVAHLRSAGFHVLNPDTGPLASGKTGKGRFPSIRIIYLTIKTIMMKRPSLAGVKFLITGGRTEEEIDTVRVITNRSSGKMALELFDAAASRGGVTRLILGETGVEAPEGGDVIRVRTAADMMAALKDNVGWCDCLLMSAAIGDYRPRNRSAGKLHGDKINLPLVKNADMLACLAPFKKKKIYVGFSLEVADQLNRAKQKMTKKGLDLVVLNTVRALGADSAEFSLLKRRGRVVALGHRTKQEVAHVILDECHDLLSLRK